MRDIYMRVAGAKLRLTVILLAVIAGAGCTPKPETHYQRGMAYLQKNDRRRATLELLNAVRKRATYTEAYYQLGVIALEQKDYQSAKRFLQTAQTLDRQKGQFINDIRVRLGQIALFEHDFKASKEAAEWVLAREPANKKARELLVLSLTGLAQPESAARELDRWLTADPSNEKARMIRTGILLAENEVEAARRQLEEAAAQPSPSADIFVALGNLYQVAKHPEKAEESYREAIKRYPENLEPHQALGWLFARLGQRQKAEEVFRAIGRLKQKDPDARGALAGYYLSLQDWPLAIGELQRLSADRTDTFNRNRLAAAYLLAGRVADARKFVQELLKQDAHDPQALLISGVLHLQAGEVDQSITEFNQVLHDKPDSATGHFYLGTALSRQRNEKVAQDHMQAALQLDPYLLAARMWLAQYHLQTASPDSALNALNGAPPEQQKLPAIRLLRAQSYIAGQNLRLALEEIRAIRAENPDSLPSYYEAVVTNLFNRRTGPARQVLEEALKAQPASLELLSLLAQTWIGEGHPEQAVARVEKQIAQLAPSAAHYGLLGDMQRTARDYAAARAAYQRAAELRPDAPQGTIGLAQAEMAAGNLEGARLQCETLTKRWPNLSLGWTLLGAVRETEKAYPEAAQAYEKALELDRFNALAANNLAWRLLSDKKDLGRALTLAQRATELEPHNGGFADTLGWIYYRMGSWTFAQQQLEAAVRREPKNVVFLYHLGVVLMELRSNKEALNNLQAALRIDSNFEDAEDALRRIDVLKDRLELAAPGK